MNKFICRLLLINVLQIVTLEYGHNCCFYERSWLRKKNRKRNRFTGLLRYESYIQGDSYFYLVILDAPLIDTLPHLHKPF